MKKLLISAIVAITAVSCSTPAKLINTSSHAVFNDPQLFVSPVYVDLNVAETKITYFYIPSKTVVNCGLDNVIDSAVSEALVQNNNADVLIGLQKQIKYDGNGEIESVVITGYPAHYTNMRSAGEKYFENLNASGAQNNADSSMIPGNPLKIGKK